MWGPNCRIKFNIEIEDATAAIEAAVFPEIAETIYGITGTNITSTAPGVKKLFFFPLKKSHGKEITTGN